MNREEIIIQFSVDGDPTITVKGIKGKGCQAVTKDLEAALGVVTNSKPTNEANQREENAKLTNRA